MYNCYNNSNIQEIQYSETSAVSYYKHININYLWQQITIKAHCIHIHMCVLLLLLKWCRE